MEKCKSPKWWWCSVAKSCPTLCDLMDWSTPGFPVFYHLSEFAQTHVRWVGDAIQPSHLLSSPSPLALSFPASGSFPVSQFFASGVQSIGASTSASVLPVNIQNWFPKDLLVWPPCSPRDSQESFLTPQSKSINSSALSFLYSPILTSIHDHRKNHSLD